MINSFSEQLTRWYRKNARPLPWRQSTEPYPVWISEVMLQQTRVNAVIGYYERFLSALPNIASLSRADDEQLMKLWEGLGYYRRAKNLKKAACVIMETHNGIFPDTHDAVLALPGIGEYTAGAICSICFNQPYPAVDGNVCRVMARYLALTEPVNLPAVKKSIQELLKPVYQNADCSALTQGLMELGATICLPKGEPKCACCPLETECTARQTNKVRAFPVLQPKKKRVIEHLTVWILRSGEDYAVCKREQDGLLSGMWQFPCQTGELNEQEAQEQINQWVPDAKLIRQSRKKHIFTHREWQMTGYYYTCGEQSDTDAQPFVWRRLSDIALPSAFRIFLA